MCFFFWSLYGSYVCSTCHASFLYCLRVPVSALFPHQGTMLQDREICCAFSRVPFVRSYPGDRPAFSRAGTPGSLHAFTGALGRRFLA
jgi:hypothetical protein